MKKIPSFRELIWRFKSRSTCTEFNLLSPLSTIRNSSLQNNVIVGDFSVIENSLIRGNNLVELGRHTYIGPNSRIISDINPVLVGNYVQFASGSQIYESNHIVEAPSLYNLELELFSRPFTHGLSSKGSVVIGHDVWIGASSIILSGVSIGHGSILGAGSVLTKSIPPYSVACGNPAKVIKPRFTKEVCDAIDATGWWLMDSNSLNKVYPYLCSLTSRLHSH